MPSSARARRERPAVDRAARRDLLGELEHERLRVGVVAADERVLLRRLLAAEVPGGERVQPGDDRARRHLLDPLRRPRSPPASGARRPAANVSSAATESTGVVPIASRSSRAVSTAPSAFVARTTRSAWRAGVRVHGALDSELRRAVGRRARSGVARADHDVVAGLAQPLRRAPGRSCPCRRRSRSSRRLPRAPSRRAGGRRRGRSSACR